MAPETFHSKIGKKSDIWSVGCLMIEMLSGENPWSQKIFDTQHGAIVALSQFLDNNEIPDIPS